MMQSKVVLKDFFSSPLKYPILLLVVNTFQLGQSTVFQIQFQIKSFRKSGPLHCEKKIRFAHNTNPQQI